MLLAVLDPNPEVCFFRSGLFNWAVMSPGDSDSDYWSIINAGPNSSPADCILVNSFRIALVPRSGRWALWGDRDMEICVLGSDIQMPNEWKSVEWAATDGIHGAFRGQIPLAVADALRRNYPPPSIGGRGY